MKINELDLDKTEHELVMSALIPLDPARKCFRMIGGVVVERTVSEVLPAVLKNKESVRLTNFSLSIAITCVRACGARLRVCSSVRHVSTSLTEPCGTL